MTTGASSSFLEAIFIAASRGEPMVRLPHVRAIAGVGLEGDRYALGTGYYSKADPCQVTLIEGETLDRITTQYAIPILEGQHRRNLVTRGVRLRELKGKRFTIGECLLEYDRPRPPCAYVERITSPGMTRALGEGAGIAARIIEEGTIREGDPLLVLPGSYRIVRHLP